MKKLTFVLSGLFLCLNISFAASNVEVKSYRIIVAFWPDSSLMIGTASVEFKNNYYEETVVFYLHNELHIDSIKYKERDLSFKQSTVAYKYNYTLQATEVSIPMREYSGGDLIISYSGSFNPSKARSQSDYMQITKEDGVLLRGYGYSLWFPVFTDDSGESYKADFEKVWIITPVAYQSVFVGEKIDDAYTSDLYFSDWKAFDVDIFDAQCTARKYNKMESKRIGVYFLGNMKSANYALPILIFSDKILDYYRKKYKRKQNTKQNFYVIEMPKYGDISSLNVVGLSAEAWLGFNNENRAKQTLAHEFVHPFVWIEATQTDRIYALVKEGFPGYFHLPALENQLGEEWYRNYIKGVEESYLNKKEIIVDSVETSLPAEKPILEITAPEIGLYKDVFVLNDRVVLFFDYLKRKMGNKKFRKFSKKLFSMDQITETKFLELIKKKLDKHETDIVLWLNTNEYPERFYCGY